MSIALQARDVRHSYGDVVALDGASLDVPEGRAVALVGESGSGKTTLMRCFNRMVEPRNGVVTVGGIGTRDQSAIELRRRLGYVPQQGGLLPHWTVLRNVSLVPTLTGMPDARAATAEALSLVGLSLEQFGSRFPHQLSGGQRQRVALARALAARPGAILLDEPFGALDAITRAEVQEAFDGVRHKLGVTTLLVTHDLAEAALLVDAIVVMRNGRVEQSGTIAELRAAPATPYVAELLERALGRLASLRLS